MRIFFSMQHLGSFLVYEPVVRELARRGHHVHLAVSRAESLGWEGTLERVLGDYPNITWAWLSPSAATSPFSFELAKTIRLWADYLRYFETHYASTPKLRARAEERVPRRLVQLSQHAAFRNPDTRNRLLSGLRVLERAMPTVPDIRQQLREQKPDVVLITPLVYLGSWQFEVLRAALAEGLRTVFAVGSWDHLSSKALIRDVPQRIFVWNETQKDEAVRLHRVPADRVVVTGAQCYDQWFDRTPLRTREEFCRHVGLPSDRPILLYVGSALFWGSPVEAEFVRRWIESVRTSTHEALRDAAILVRPHPARMDEWRTVDLSPFCNVAVYGSNPTDGDSKEDYFESLFYSNSVVGLNTSAFLEAAIVGRPVHTIITPEFAENQEGTLHFRYLTTVGGGVLQVSRSFDEHQAQLAASLGDPTAHARRNQQFVREFIRPHGLAVAATPIFCDGVEAMLALPVPVRERTTLPLFALRWLSYPAFLMLRRIYGTELFRDDWRRNDREHQLQLEERERQRAARRLAAEEIKRARERRRTEKAAARTAALEAEQAVRQRHRAEKARRLAAKAREKAARARRRERTAIRARLKRGAKSWLGRWRVGRQGQAT
jgi:hypothetical protein